TEDIILPLMAVSTQDLQAADELQVSPNPATDVLNISVSGADEEQLHVELLDLSGRSVLRQAWNKEALNIAELAAGQYVLRLIGEKKMWVQRIVKE
ncbi:MAG: T9SS type A sorting domain-containing protein, partial [Saprospiraceae bacterium]|nr:T9SS type A sorting domain-containing protein [Saprospiraceae bacterium]